jgi:uncharacterized OB-fold protein
MADEREPIKYITTPIRLEYHFSAGEAASMFLRGLAQKKIIGARSRPGEPVMVPPRGADPRTAELTPEAVEISDKGTVVSFSIVRVPAEGIDFELPYVCINILLDGAGLAFFHVLQNCPLEEVRLGMRVQAKWVPDDQLEASVRSIQYFEPIDEPDVPFEQIREQT